MKELEQKVALVTAATRGIGWATAKALAAHGAKTYLAVRNLAAGEKQAAELQAAGGSVGVVYFDAEKEESAVTMVKDVLQNEGRLDILVNNYGGTDVQKDLDLVQGDCQAFFDIIQRNLSSVYLSCKTAVPAMEKQGGGNIINISSVGGMVPDVSRLAYGVAKAAINFLTQSIAVQYGAAGVRCNAVLPGLVKTEAALHHMPADFLAAFVEQVPLGRMATADEIAQAILFLASEEAAFITSLLLPVAGGFALPSPLYGFYQQQKEQQKEQQKQNET